MNSSDGTERVRLPVGSKVKFLSEKQRYTVQASDGRFAICTKPFNLKHTVFYTIIDFQEDVRGPENLIFGMGAETREDCEEMLARLTAPCEHVSTEDLIAICDCRTEVSHRNRITLDIEKVYEPKSVTSSPEQEEEIESSEGL